MNDALDRVLGCKSVDEMTTTADVAPVVATVPSWRHLERRKDGKKRKSGVASVIGETQDSVIPSDATDAEEGDFNSAQGVNVPKPKEAKSQPDQPASEEDKLMAPRSALVAPDVTPDSMTEIDPVDVPGTRGGASFRASDLSAQPQQQAQRGPDQTDAAVSQMDILLGRQRSTPNGPGTPPPIQPVMSEDAAAAIFNQKSGKELLAGGVEVPPPSGRVDAKTVCEATRKWM